MEVRKKRKSKQYTYFISFAVIDGYRFAFGNWAFVYKQKIKDWESLQEIRDFIAKKQEIDKENIIILNFQLLN